MKQRLRVARAIGWVTFKEILRDKILYNTVVFALFLMAIGFLASRLTFARPERVVLDFGVSAVNLSCAAIAILLGSNLLLKEIERRTIHVALSRPITRAQFVVGKFAGLGALLFVNWMMLASALAAILFVSGTGGVENFSAVFFQAMLLIWLQSLVLGAIAILVSTFSTASLSVVICAGLYLIGNNVSQIRAIADKMQSPAASWGLKALAAFLPNLESFNLGLRVTYGLPPEWGSFGLALVYAGVLAAFSLSVAGALLQRREL